MSDPVPRGNPRPSSGDYFPLRRPALTGGVPHCLLPEHVETAKSSFSPTNISFLLVLRNIATCNIDFSKFSTRLLNRYSTANRWCTRQRPSRDNAPLVLAV